MRLTHPPPLINPSVISSGTNEPYGLMTLSNKNHKVLARKVLPKN